MGWPPYRVLRNKDKRRWSLPSERLSAINGQVKLKEKSFSCVQLFVTPWTVAYQAPLSMGFSRQEYWNGLPFPSPEMSQETLIIECD